MQISPVSFSIINRNKLNLKRNNISFKADLDSFERTQDNLFSPERIKEALSNPANEIGHGSKHRVFAIPNNEEYVLRVPKYNFNPNDITQATFQPDDDGYEINIGQMIGTIETDGGPYNSNQTIEVLKKQRGKSYGVPHISALSDENGKIYADEPAWEDKKRKASYRDLISKVSRMDIDTFVKLIETINKVQSDGYGFDPYNCNNLLVADNEINIIDLEKVPMKCSYIELLNLLTNYEYNSTYRADREISDNEKMEVSLETADIIEKFLKAMQRLGLKFDEEYVQNQASQDLYRSFEFLLALELNPMLVRNAEQKLKEMNLK